MHNGKKKKIKKNQSRDAANLQTKHNNKSKELLFVVEIKIKKQPNEPRAFFMKIHLYFCGPTSAAPINDHLVLSAVHSNINSFYRLHYPALILRLQDK